MLGTPVTYAYAIDLLRSSVIILSFGVFFPFIPSPLADIQQKFLQVSIMCIYRKVREKGEGVREEGRGKLLILKGIYGWRSSMSLDYPNILPYYLKYSSNPELQYISCHLPLNWTSISLTVPLPYLSPPSLPPPGFVVSSPSADMCPRRIHSV